MTMTTERVGVLPRSERLRRCLNDCGRLVGEIRQHIGLLDCTVCEAAGVEYEAEMSASWWQHPHLCAADGCGNRVSVYAADRPKQSEAALPCSERCRQAIADDIKAVMDGDARDRRLAKTNGNTLRKRVAAAKLVRLDGQHWRAVRDCGCEMRVEPAEVSDDGWGRAVGWIVVSGSQTAHYDDRKSALERGRWMLSQQCGCESEAAV